VAATIASALRAALDRLAALPSPRSDAEELLSRLLGLARSQLHLQNARPLTEAEVSRFDAWLARRVMHEPVQYITGRAAFRGLDLAVGSGVLIPRPETEGLVEVVLGGLRASAWPAPRVLDLGTGSGAIALAIAAEWPAAVVTATDAGAAALERARANAVALGLAARVRFASGRWFEAVGEGDRFEVVVSNPPYIAAGEWDALPEDVRGFEPPAALLAGPRGLDDLRAIVDGAPRHLVPGGLLALELAETRAGEVAGWLTGSPEWEGVEVRPDLAGRPRCLLARAVAAPGDHPNGTPRPSRPHESPP
jgi:release factor glutamine methyltransferase